MSSQSQPPLACLRCNADLLPGDNRCPRCGWVNHYRSQSSGWAYQQVEQWQPTTIQPAFVEGIGDDEHPSAFARLYSWLLAPPHRAFTLAGLAVLILGAALGYYLAQGSGKPNPGIVIALASPAPAPPATLFPTGSTPFQPVPIATMAPAPPTPTPAVAEYQVNATTLQASHILTVTTDAGQLQFILFYDAAPITVSRLTSAIDQELLTNNQVRRDPDLPLTYLAASTSSSAVSFERNNLPFASGVLVEDSGNNWSDYRPISLAVVNDPARLQPARLLIVYGRMVGGSTISAATHQVKGLSYVICSSTDQHTVTSPCSLTYEIRPTPISVKVYRNRR